MESKCEFAVGQNAIPFCIHGRLHAGIGWAVVMGDAWLSFLYFVYLIMHSVPLADGRCHRTLLSSIGDFEFKLRGCFSHVQYYVMLPNF